ncbi:hypothetical protein Bca4012_094669 [Brassica carinata]|uniref:Uncharacterized protein n=1 Tax=Brassica carinata TaxID=52824 RepID=A0A8X7PVV2_BRACI|nr:hypothetical protein Bca52824_076787 [Brassica carinata]
MHLPNETVLREPTHDNPEMPQTHHRGGTSPYYLHNGLREPQMSSLERWRNTRSRATWPGQQNTIIGGKRPDPQRRSHTPLIEGFRQRSQKRKIETRRNTAQNPTPNSHRHHNHIAVSP